MFTAVIAGAIGVAYKLLSKPMNYRYNDDVILGIIAAVIGGLILISLFIRLIRALVDPEEDYDDLTFVSEFITLTVAAFILVLMIVGYTSGEFETLGIIFYGLIIVTFVVLWVSFIKKIIEGYNVVFLIQTYVFQEIAGLIAGVIFGVFSIVIISITILQAIFSGFIFVICGFGLFSDDYTPLTWEDLLFFNILFRMIK